MAQEKIRLFQLAAQLNMKAKDLLELCQKNGMNLTNQLNTLDVDQRDKVIELARRGTSAPKGTSSATTAKPPPAERKIVNLGTSRPQPRETKAPESPSVSAVETVIEPPPPAAPPPPVAPAAVVEPPPAPAPMPAPEPPPVPEPPPLPPPAPVAQKQPAPPPPPPAPEPVAPPVAVTPPAPPPKAPEPPPAPKVPEPPAQPRPAATTPPKAPPTPPAPPPPSAPPRPVAPPAPQRRPMRDLSSSRSGGPRPGEKKGPPPPVVPQTGKPSGNFRGGPTPPPPQRPSKPGDEKKAPPPPQQSGPKKIADIPPEMLQGNKPIRLEDILKKTAAAAAAAAATLPENVEVPEEEEDDGKKGDKDKKKRPGSIVGREQRHADRAKRAQERLTRTDGKGMLLDDETPRATRLLQRKRKIERGTQPRKGKVPIQFPISVRSLSEAIGIKAGDLIKKLMMQNIFATINTGLEPEVAEMIALEHGAELEIKKQFDAEDVLNAGLQKPDTEEELQPRAPIVTIMGHVDHGKTSLLDYIRKSNVVATEAGGITQSLRAWRVEHGGRPITFLDTPGHEAFTKMRARGANVTDIAVIVVAASDGVQPQTEEAISHAKAAEVAIIVAINKVDLPNANIKKTEAQLLNLGLAPDTLGGDVHFVHTSAVTGKGVDELLETISLVADYELELKSNPNKPGRGTCLEASVSEGEGVVATVLVQEGTLKRGDVMLCGAASGRIRMVYNDLGLPIEAATPSMPCRVTGLDEVPNADDPFFVVADLAQGAEIAEKRKQKVREAAQKGREALGLDALTQVKATELKVVIKADVRGSLEAIKKELERLNHEEVKLRILHTGLGGINESDVSLATISPTDTLVVGFNVVPDDAAQAMADSRGIKLREYQIIYELTGDVKAAMEGKLKPREEIVHLGRAVVRETFKISRVGTIAGCRVTQGGIERSAKIRVIRNGIVVYPPADRTASLESLKRFKDDVREVQQGYECGLKIAGYDDVKVDDVVECYRIEQVQRTLS